MYLVFLIVTGSAATIQALMNFGSYRLIMKFCDDCDIWYTNSLIIIAAIYGVTIVVMVIIFSRVIYLKLAAFVSLVTTYVFCNRFSNIPAT